MINENEGDTQNDVTTLTKELDEALGITPEQIHEVALELVRGYN